MRRTDDSKAGARRGFKQTCEDLCDAFFARVFNEVQMGMPTLKRFARPLGWAGIDAVLRRYARKVRKARAGGEEEARTRRCLQNLVGLVF